jgi:HEPN domain-containing protein
MRFAKDDLDASQLGPEILAPEIMCFHAQQAAEKALKAVLASREIDFLYTHDIGELVSTLEQSGVECTDISPEANRLTRYAVLTRYPGLSEPITNEEYQAAARLAEEIFVWADSQINGND